MQEGRQHIPPINLALTNEITFLCRKPEILTIPLEGDGYIKFTYPLEFDDNRLPQRVTVGMGSFPLDPEHEVEYCIPGTAVTDLHQTRQRYNELQQRLATDPKFQEDFKAYKDDLSTRLRYQLAGNLLEAVSGIDYDTRQPTETERAMINRTNESGRAVFNRLYARVGTLRNGSDFIKYLLASGDDVFLDYGLGLVQRHLVDSLQDDLQRVCETRELPLVIRKIAFGLLSPEKQKSVTERLRTQR